MQRRILAGREEREDAGLGRSGTTSESWCVRGVSSFSPASSWGLCAPLGNPAGDLNCCLVAGPSWGCVSNLINKIDEQGL